MEPVIEALKEQYGKDVVFVKVDVGTQDGRALAVEYGIRGIPHIIMIKGQGEVVYNQVGSRSGDDLRVYLDRLL